jgi:hypothetical protein
MNKKAEMEHMFTTLITIAVVIIILIFGSITITKTLNRLQEIELVDFANKLQENIKQMDSIRGSRVFTYEIPSRIKTIMFIDTTNQRALLNNEVIKNNPLLYDSVQTPDNINMFLLSKKGDLIKSFNIGEITIGQFGDQECTGVGILEINIRTIQLRITNKPGTGIVLGEECLGMKYYAFQGPFDENIVTQTGGIQRLQITGNRRQITLINNELEIGPNYEEVYFQNGSINTSLVNINSMAGMRVDRIFYSTDTPADTDILFRVGFKNSNNNQWNFYGPNITALDNQTEQYYYYYPGQYITQPDYNYSQVKAQIWLFASEDKLITPTFHWLTLSYYD